MGSLAGLLTHRTGQYNSREENKKLNLTCIRLIEDISLKKMAEKKREHGNEISSINGHMKKPRRSLMT